MKARVKSFDLWDTLITRLVMRPGQVFELVERLSGETGFAEARKRAERSSRVGVNETNLPRIYDHLHYDDEKKHQLMQLELELETSLSSRICVNDLQRSATDIVVSDMYLSSEQLLKITANCGLELGEERLFVSSQHGISKHHGALFDHVLEKFDLEFHIGDNKRGDVLVPATKGIRTVHYADWKPNALEKHWAGKSGEEKYVAGALRAARLLCPSSDPQHRRMWEVCSQVVAPFLLAFVEWVLDECNKKNIRSLFFVAPNGQILQRLATQICQARDLGISCTYIHAPLRVLQLAAHQSIDRSERWILADAPLLSLSTVAERTGIDLGDVVRIASPAIAAQADEILDAGQRSLMRDVIRSPEFLQRLELAAQKASENAGKYYAHAGLCMTDGQREQAIVDVGWNAELKNYLESIVSKGGEIKQRLCGYYMRLPDECENEAGQRMYAFSSRIDDPADVAASIDRYREAMDLFLAADHPAVVDFAGQTSVDNAQAVFAAPLEDARAERVRFRQDAIMSFVSRLSSLEAAVRFSVRCSKQAAVGPFYQLLMKPTRAQSEALRCELRLDRQAEGPLGAVPEENRFRGIVGKAKSFPWMRWHESRLASGGMLWAYRVRDFLMHVRNSLPWRK